MNIYDFKYRLKRDKDADILVKTFTAKTKQDAILMFDGVVNRDKYTIVEIIKV